MIDNNTIDNDALVAGIAGGSLKLVDDHDEKMPEAEAKVKEPEQQEPKAKRPKKEKADMGEGWASFASYLEQIVRVVNDNEFLFNDIQSILLWIIIAQWISAQWISAQWISVLLEVETSMEFCVTGFLI